MNKLPKLILTDIDGVWTDGGMYYDQEGLELKSFILMIVQAFYLHIILVFLWGSLQVRIQK